MRLQAVLSLDRLASGRARPAAPLLRKACGPAKSRQEAPAPRAAPRTLNKGRGSAAQERRRRSTRAQRRSKLPRRASLDERHVAQPALVEPVFVLIVELLQRLHVPGGWKAGVPGGACGVLGAWGFCAAWGFTGTGCWVNGCFCSASRYLRGGGLVMLCQGVHAASAGPGVSKGVGP